MRFNLRAASARYAEVAVALGVDRGTSDEKTAERGVACVEKLRDDCGLPSGLAELGVPEAAIPRMARAAMQVTRLLKNNPRPLSEAEAEAIYRAAY